MVGLLRWGVLSRACEKGWCLRDAGHSGHAQIAVVVCSSMVFCTSHFPWTAVGQIFWVGAVWVERTLRAHPCHGTWKLPFLLFC